MADRKKKIQESLDWDEGVNGFGGDEEMFTMMVGKFEGLTFNEGMKKMYQSMLEQNWPAVRHEAHTIKGSSGYFTYVNNFATSSCYLIC